MKAHNYDATAEWHAQRLQREELPRASDVSNDESLPYEDDSEDEVLERWQLTDLCELLRQQSNRLEAEIAHQHIYTTAIGIIALAAFIIAIAK